MLNITAIGNLGREPELKSIGEKQIPAASFSLGVKTGKDQTTWLNYTVFGEGKAEIIMNFYKKGSKVAVSGRGNLRVYEGLDGTEKTSMDLVVNDFTLPEKQKDNGSDF